MPFNLDKFVTSPSVEELDSLKKSEIVKVAKHYGIEFQPLMRKDEIKRYVLEYLVDESILPSTVLETAITVPTDNTFELKRLEMEMNKEIGLKEMEREKEKEEREMQREAREHEFRLKQLELVPIKGSDPKIGLDTGGFDVSKHVKFVPKFQEENVEKFFNHFEKLGEQLKWPRDKWSILIQSNFTGKAQEVYSALSIEDSMDYDKVKKAILQAYELVPEAYRQKFRKYRKADIQTYVEFAYQKERHFDRWCASKKVSTFDTLRQLMLVEEFKRCVNDDIKTHLEENKADKLKEVANLADQYALTHKFSEVGQTQNKGQFSRPNKKYGNNSGTTSNSGSQSGSISPTNSGKKQPDSSRQKNDQVSSNKAAFKDISCGFCHKKGHTMANCFTLAKLKETETASTALANVENSSEVVVTLRPNSNDQVKEEYLPFASEGFISLDGNSAHPPVKIKILRDTGATQSLLLDGVLPLSDSTSTGANVLIKGVECGFISVPLHKINLKSDLVSGSVIVGVRPTLPVKGVSLLLGNDLAGGKVVANAILTDKPCDYNSTEQLEKEFPNLFPACAVTRAMSQKLAMDDNLKHPPSKSEDTVPKSGTSRESCKDDNLKHPLSKNEGMISENKDDKLNHPPSKVEELVPKNGTTLPKEESESEKDSNKNIHENEDSWYDLSQSFMTNLNDSQDCESPDPTHSEGMLYELGIDQIKSSAYHPESQGALERFHQTLKNMLKTYCHGNERDWDEGIPFVMFAARESIQESLGFSPFELVFGHTVRGPLKLLKEKWLSDPGEDIHLLDYVSRFKDRLHGACELAQENLRHSQKKMKAWYDKTTVKREFKPGDKVLVFLPVSGQPLQARFQGPYVIERKVSDTDYVILTPDKRKSKRVCHINMMKRYYEREDCDISKDESVHDVNSNTNDAGDQVCIINADHELSNDEIKANNVPDMCIKLQNSDVLKNLNQKLSHLDHKEKSEMKSLIYEYACLFSDDPTRTNLIEHDVDVGDATPFKQHPYRVNPRKRQHLRDEARYMLDHDIIEPSNSEWSSPCILVPKPDGGYRFCTDCRKVNAVTRTDSYPIPRIDDCIDRIGKATYVSKFDLLKGYWEIPLTERARKISAFVTPDGLFQYKVMPFGMKNSPMTFQRLVNNLTSNLENCEVYVDDLIVYSNSWDEHVQHIKALFDKLAKANLTVNLVKSEIACAQVIYLGHVVGQALSLFARGTSSYATERCRSTTVPSSTCMHYQPLDQTRQILSKGFIWPKGSYKPNDPCGDRPGPPTGGTGGQMFRGPGQYGGPGKIGHKIYYIISNYFLVKTTLTLGSLTQSPDAYLAKRMKPPSVSSIIRVCRRYVFYGNELNERFCSLCRA
ncbi:hypothetical protein HOLleu_14412 [Holothuria leucospilota]|uniref:Reverse transcriptase n=1 Tax=Holothuria leucospilota TaxID=206669 RepID=A0A9Q1HCG1_HOLLE|nr:hypothetical protein HOLleu_14412 [Holothuria leucospilota]